MKTQWISGDWNAICDQCARQFKASQLRKRWDGLMVCAEDYETRHPQEFVRTKPDTGKVPWTRPLGDLNPDGTPRLSVAPTFNCAGATWMQVPNRIVQRTYIGKGYTDGPSVVEDGVEVIVLCEWVIND